MNKKLLKLTAVLSAGAMALSLLAAVPTGEKYGSVAETAYAAATRCTTYSGENISDQNYSRWSSPINSYLTAVDSNTLMRFQADADSSSYIVEYYDTSYNIKSTVKVTKELPIFGGVYFDTDYYYVVSGQTNTEESADTEVFRITKYTKDRQRVSSSQRSMTITAQFNPA